MTLTQFLNIVEIGMVRITILRPPSVFKSRDQKRLVSDSKSLCVRHPFQSYNISCKPLAASLFMQVYWSGDTNVRDNHVPNFSVLSAAVLGYLIMINNQKLQNQISLTVTDEPITESDLGCVTTDLSAIEIGPVCNGHIFWHTVLFVNRQKESGGMCGLCF